MRDVCKEPENFILTILMVTVQRAVKNGCSSYDDCRLVWIFLIFYDRNSLQKSFTSR